MDNSRKLGYAKANPIYNKTAVQEDDPWADPTLELPAVDTGIPDLALNHDHYLYGVCKQTIITET